FFLRTRRWTGERWKGASSALGVSLVSGRSQWHGTGLQQEDASGEAGTEEHEDETGQPEPPQSFDMATVEAEQAELQEHDPQPPNHVRWGDSTAFLQAQIELWATEIVCTHMTKTDLLTGRRRGNAIADLDVVVSDHHAVNEEFDKLAFLFKAGYR